MAAFVTCLLCVVVIIRPQDFVQELASAPLLHVLSGLIFLCIVLDVSQARIRLTMAPQIPIFFAFLAWALLISLVKRPDAFTLVLGALAALSCVFLAVSIGLATAQGIKLFLPVFIGCSLLVAYVAITQYMSPFQCFRRDAGGGTTATAFIPDGRPCESSLDCHTEDSVDRYLCERGGLFNTRTVAGRVRYLGQLEDPNELALLVTSALPFGLALIEVHRRRRDGERPAPGPRRSPAATGTAMGAEAVWSRRLLAAMLIALVGFMIVITQSRMGLIVFLLIMAIYFVRRAGAWGVLLACMAAPPMLLFGGRSGSAADASTGDRTEVIFEAFEMIRRTKGIGVGVGQFVGESSVSKTAHNAYLLAAAEAGPVGAILFGTFLYLCIKVPMALWFGRYRISPATAGAAPALAISLCGVAVGIAFLSWTYEPVLYLLAAASCALYTVAKVEDPAIDLRLSAKEMVLVPLGVIALLAAFFIGARLRL